MQPIKRYVMDNPLALLWGVVTFFIVFAIADGSVAQRILYGVLIAGIPVWLALVGGLYYLGILALWAILHRLRIRRDHWLSHLTVATLAFCLGMSIFQHEWALFPILFVILPLGLYSAYQFVTLSIEDTSLSAGTGVGRRILMMIVGVLFILVGALGFFDPTRILETLPFGIIGVLAVLWALFKLPAAERIDEAVRAEDADPASLMDVGKTLLNRDPPEK